MATVGPLQPTVLGASRSSASRKNVAFILDVGGYVRPFITPVHPDALRTVLEEHGVDFA